MTDLGTPLATIDQIREIDRRAQAEYGISEMILMEGAGLLAWQRLKLLHSVEHGLLVVAGRGNNGGDALVMARYAAVEHVDVTVLLADEPRDATPAAIHAHALERMGVRVLHAQTATESAASAIQSATLVLDGIAGSGISGAIRSPLDALVARLNQSSATVVSLDVPSGLSATWSPSDPIVAADATLELGAPKSVCYSPAARVYCGRLETVEIGFPPELVRMVCGSARRLGPLDLPLLLPALTETVHKGQRGRLEIVGGAQGMTGAPVLAGEAALHARAGLVRLVLDPSLATEARSMSLSLMQRIGSAHEPAWEFAVIGPGWGRAEHRSAELSQALTDYAGGVIDADGLRALAILLQDDRARAKKLLSDGAWVVTPHPGEFVALAASVDLAYESTRPIESATTLASELGVVVVAKGPATAVVGQGGEVSLVDGANAALATAGTGDVLAGAIGGLMTSGCEAYTAACAGVLAHQEAGRVLREEQGFFASSELPAALGKVIDV